MATTTASTPASAALTRPLSAALTALRPSRSQLPPADSVAFYAALAVVGIVEIVEWPAVLIAAAAQVLLDRRLGPLEDRLAHTAGSPAGPSGR